MALEVTLTMTPDRLDLIRKAISGVFQVILEDVRGVDGPLGDHTARWVDELAAIQREPFTFMNASEDVVAYVIDQWNPGLEEDPWT